MCPTRFRLPAAIAAGASKRFWAISGGRRLDQRWINSCRRIQRTSMHTTDGLGRLHAHAESGRRLGRGPNVAQQYQPCRSGPDVSMSMIQAQLFQRQLLRFAQLQHAFHRCAAPFLVCIPNASSSNSFTQHTYDYQNRCVSSYWRQFDNALPPSCSVSSSLQKLMRIMPVSISSL